MNSIAAGCSGKRKAGCLQQFSPSEEMCGKTAEEACISGKAGERNGGQLAKVWFQINA